MGLRLTLPVARFGPESRAFFGRAVLAGTFLRLLPEETQCVA
jgi:hypothetical protein